MGTPALVDREPIGRSGRSPQGSALPDGEPWREHIHISLEGREGHLVCYGPPALFRQLLALIATRPSDAWPSRWEDAHVEAADAPDTAPRAGAE